MLGKFVKKISKEKLRFVLKLIFLTNWIIFIIYYFIIYRTILI